MRLGEDMYVSVKILCAISVGSPHDDNAVYPSQSTYLWLVTGKEKLITQNVIIGFAYNTILLYVITIRLRNVYEHTSEITRISKSLSTLYFDVYREPLKTVVYKTSYFIQTICTTTSCA